MRFTILWTMIVSILLFSKPAFAFEWDPVGDILHPERIIQNASRELGNLGRGIDRNRLELQAQAGAPVLKNWIIESRNNTLRAGVNPIPPEIRARLTGFFPERLLDKVRYRSGVGHFLSLQNSAFKIEGKRAITLDYVIVFENDNTAKNDDALWAHELAHVDQYERWGIHDFSVRYLRSWNSVENEAEDVGSRYVSARDYSVLPSVSFATNEVTINNPTNGPISFYLTSENTERTQHWIEAGTSTNYAGIASDRNYTIEVFSQNSKVEYKLNAGDTFSIEWNQVGLLDVYRNE